MVLEAAGLKSSDGLLNGRIVRHHAARDRKHIVSSGLSLLKSHHDLVTGSTPLTHPILTPPKKLPLNTAGSSFHPYAIFHWGPKLQHMRPWETYKNHIQATAEQESHPSQVPADLWALILGIGWRGQREHPLNTGLGWGSGHHGWKCTKLNQTPA